MSDSAMTLIKIKMFLPVWTETYETLFQKMGDLKIGLAKLQMSEQLVGWSVCRSVLVYAES